MTAPSPSARVTPTGSVLRDGYQALITFEADTDVTFWERSIQPPSVEGGDMIDNTTQHNTSWRTGSPRSLLTLGNAECTVTYDPKVYDEIISLINTNTTVTVHFPDTSSLAFFGYLQSFSPSSIEEGSDPEATVTIVATNIDPASGEEEGPVYTVPSGT